MPRRTRIALVGKAEARDREARAAEIEHLVLPRTVKSDLFADDGDEDDAEES